MSIIAGLGSDLNLKIPNKYYSRKIENVIIREYSFQRGNKAYHRAFQELLNDFDLRTEIPFSDLATIKALKDEAIEILELYHHQYLRNINVIIAKISSYKTWFDSNGNKVHFLREEFNELLDNNKNPDYESVLMIVESIFYWISIGTEVDEIYKLASDTSIKLGYKVRGFEFRYDDLLESIRDQIKRINELVLLSTPVFLTYSKYQLQLYRHIAKDDAIHVLNNLKEERKHKSLIQSFLDKKSYHKKILTSRFLSFYLDNGYLKDSGEINLSVVIKNFYEENPDTINEVEDKTLRNWISDFKDFVI